MVSQANSIKQKEELIPILLKLFLKIAEGTLPKTFDEMTITQIQKPDKDITQKENNKPISFIQTQKFSTEFQPTREQDGGGVRGCA